MTGTILVSGGAGYIGSHTVLALRESGRDVLVLDDLSEGHAAALLGAPLANGSMLDREFVRDVFRAHRIAAVFHFAARCYVGESVTDPGRYYRHNVVGTMNLLDAMVETGVKRFVLSSTCATYGEPERMPITEDLPQRPINPYGATKLIDEWLLRDYHRAHGLESVALRYFNAAGADPQARIGEDHEPETHLIPIVIQVAQARREHVTVFGNDYPTQDGTCIRDYVHVTDLADAHVRALLAMEKGSVGVRAYNLGNTAGTSVLEVIRTVEQVSGRRVKSVMGARRPGDPPRLVGSSARIQAELGWQPRFGDIKTIVETAWRWHERRPDGYGDRRPTTAHG
ncbi:MAG: UDP-glucose 4-epimerase GalE [Planctomycetes bacterium]|nr:UDP-glucose 4-epimerase GalE [Planctomycetota bacterium]